MNRYKKKIFKRILCFLSLSFILMGTLARTNIDARSTLNWHQQDTMDINLNVIPNKTGDNDLLFSFDLEENGRYIFEYFLRNGEKTTVYFDNNYENFGVSYKVEEKKEVPPASGSYTVENKTQSLLDSSYLEVDYTGDLPIWKGDTGKTLSPDGSLKYTINRSASLKYPGLAFNLANRRFIFRWDIREKKAYVLFDKYQAGNMMPVRLTSPLGEEDEYIVLKKPEGFLVTPTHLVPSSDGKNYDLSPIVMPSESEPQETPGSRPGIRLQFKQPKTFDENDWTYKYQKDAVADINAIFDLKDLASGEYMDIKFKLDPSNDKKIQSLPKGNADISYMYDDNKNLYTVDIVKDKSDLNLKNTIIQWDKLEASKIYNSSLSFEKTQATTKNYMFRPYLPDNKFAYTYLEYIIRRHNKTQAFLEIIPYDAGVGGEVEYNILYSKSYEPKLSILNHLWSKHYETGNANDTKIKIPVPFSATSSQDHYQVLLKFAGNDMYSQLLQYKAEKDKNIPPTTPEIKVIDNVNVVPKIDDKYEAKQISMDLTWTAPTNRETKALDEIFEDKDNNPANDRIYYELSVNVMPNDSETNPYQIIRVYEVYKKDQKYYLKKHDGIEGNEEAKESSGIGFKHGYDSIEELFAMERIALFENGEYVSVLETNYEDSTYEISKTSKKLRFEFPGVNYFRLRAITSRDGIITESEQSTPYSVSFSMSREEIPIVGKMTYEAYYDNSGINPLGVEVTWRPIDKLPYEKYMVLPVMQKIKNIRYNAYLTKDRDTILKLDINDPKIVKLEKDADNTLTFDEGMLASLRDKKEIYKIETINNKLSDMKLKLRGLEENEVYHMRFEVEFDIEDKDGNVSTRKGKLSEILELTIPLKVEEPSEEELVPLLPENVKAELLEKDDLNSKLSWSSPTSIDIRTDNFAFEIFTIEDKKLADKLKDKKISIESLINNPSMEKDVTEAIRIYKDGNNVGAFEYNKDKKIWQKSANERLSQVGREFIYYDVNNSPNRVLYYYIRTVKLDENKNAVSRSNWIEATVTTAPIKGPVNLIIDYASKVEYDKYTQTLIRFDAPIAKDAKIGSDYIMQIFVKGEDDLDYHMTKYRSSHLRQEYMEDIDHLRLYYRISGLKPGKSYDIKVRIEDRTKPLDHLPDGSSRYPLSAFSNIVTTRTNFDQRDHDSEEKYKEFIEYYEKRGAQLKERPYFDLSSYYGRDKGRLAVKYRGEYIEGDMKTNKDYILFDVIEKMDIQAPDLAKEEKREVNYYLPAEFIKSMNKLDKNILIRLMGQEIIIKSDSIDEAIPQIRDIEKEINKMASRIKDYELCLTISLGDYKKKVNNMKALSPYINLRLTVIPKKRQEFVIDREIERIIDGAINSNRHKLIKKLDENIKKSLTDAELYELVKEVIVDVEKQVSTAAYTKLQTYLDDKKNDIFELEKDMIIGFDVINTKPVKDLESKFIDLYHLENGKWTKLDQLSNKTASFTTKKTGLYVPVSNDSLSSLASNYTKDQAYKVNQYGIDRIFTDDMLKNPNYQPYSEQVIKTFAAIMGAGPSQQNANYLKTRGIDLPRYRPYGKMNRDEIYYMYTQVYAHKKGIDLKAVPIRNYRSIDDIGKSKYKLSLLKGMQIKAYSLSDKRLRPEDHMNMVELMNLIKDI